MVLLESGGVPMSVRPNTARARVRRALCRSIAVYSARVFALRFEPLSRPGDVLTEPKGAAPGALNENGGCEDGQGSLSLAPASSLSLRFRSRVGEEITTARSPR